MVAVAQLAERRVVVADVAGSNPVGHPNERGVNFRLLNQSGFAPRSCFRTSSLSCLATESAVMSAPMQEHPHFSGPATNGPHSGAP